MLNPAGGDGEANGDDLRGNAISIRSGLNVFFKRDWKPGDWVIYRLSKYGRSPGQRAHQVSAAPKGESYNYVVDKFWVVEQVTPTGHLVVRTPGGKSRTLDAGDPNLHRARWWHRFQWGNRFRDAEKQMSRNAGTAEPA